MVELLLRQIRVGVKHLIALNFDDVRFNSSATKGYDVTRVLQYESVCGARASTHAYLQQRVASKFLTLGTP